MSSDLDTDLPVMPEPEEPPGHRLPAVTPERVLAVLALLVPIVAMLWVGSYDKLGPEVGGVPFFYWYQLLWVPASAVFTVAAYLLINRDEKARRAARAGKAGEVR
ncbi:Protein of unknown function [Streptomyces sp. TLI_053]|nr:Protein of unknown function [Streptomyces sp. TLI_053]